VYHFINNNHHHPKILPIIPINIIIAKSSMYIIIHKIIAHLKLMTKFYNLFKDNMINSLTDP